MNPEHISNKNTAPDDSLTEPVWRPFPLGALPENIQRFVRETAESIGIDLAFVAPAVLSAFSGLVGRSTQIELKRAYCEIAPIWTLLVASSGSGKTPALNAVLAPIRDFGGGITVRQVSCVLYVKIEN